MAKIYAIELPLFFLPPPPVPDGLVASLLKYSAVTYFVSNGKWH